jgi:hypothetical protein
MDPHAIVRVEVRKDELGACPFLGNGWDQDYQHKDTCNCSEYKHTKYLRANKCMCTMLPTYEYLHIQKLKLLVKIKQR